jgi:DNA-directed RNA polymerase specialized sigma subunit
MVAELKTYHAEVTRDGKFWLIRIPEIDRSTQALRYKDVAVMASDLVEIITGLSTDDYDLHINVHLPTEVQDHLARAEVLREEAKRKNSEAAKESRAAVRQLLAQGLSQREAGELLGMSFQRISQLVKSS